MAELELTRSGEDRKMYVLQGVGSLRLGGWFSRSATASVEGREWRMARRGVFSAAMEATDAAGSVVGEFHNRAIRRGGALRWAGREYELRPASMWKERYALADGDRELAVLEGKGWGKRPVKVLVEDLDALDPALLLFTAFVVRGLAEDAGATASSGSTASIGATTS